MYSVKDKEAMKFFNYEALWILSHGNPTLMLKYFKLSNSGENFIVNQRALVDAFWLTDRQKAEYLGICSLRSYDDYLINKEVNLNRDLIPVWVPDSVITTNPLIQPTNTQIILLKEQT